VRFIDLDGRQLSVVGLGCWQFGAKEWGYGAEYSMEDSLAVMRRALELGVTVFDTAELYGSGRSETLVGDALQHWDQDRFLATKFLPVVPLPKVMASHCERSLERLQVPLVDLYQIHWPNPAVPLGRQMEGMRRILASGWSRYAGVSNFSLKRWIAAERCLGQAVISNQVRYNLLRRQPEEGLLDYAQQRSRLILAYSPLAQGILSGRYHAGNAPRDLRRASTMFTDIALDAAEPVLKVLLEVADAHHCTPSQAALAYVISHPRVIAIPGAKSLAQLESNVEAAEIELGEDELLALRRAADLFQYSKARAAAQVAGRLLGSRMRGKAA
jgi:aryl-alcohol dehydrogenase-like predicted oxidoreductase